MIGSSAWQCGHQGAQTSSTAGWPANSFHDTLPPVRAGPENGGTLSPACSMLVRAGPDTLTGLDAPPPPFVDSTDTSSTATATTRTIPPATNQASLCDR